VPGLKRAALAAALVLTPAAAWAEGPPWPGYQVKPFRWDEDYSELKGHELDAWPLKAKYVPLGDRDWLSFGGEYRFRVDDYAHPDFGLRSASDFTSSQHRLLAHADAHFGPDVRVFVQLGAAAEEGRKPFARPFDRSDLDLAQAFADLGWGPSSARWRLRVGRQELGLGRFVANRDGANIRRAFDGVRLDGVAAGWSLTAVAADATRNRPDAFDDRADGHDRLALVALDHALPAKGLRLGLTVLEHDNDTALYAAGSGRERRATLGARVYGAWGPWDLDGQVSWQTGRFTPSGRAGLDIDAWGAAFEGGRKFAGPGSPRLAVRIDAAGGDRDPGDGRLGTFDLPYPNLSYLTDAAVFAPRNVGDIQPFVTVSPTRGLTVTGGIQVMWRIDRADAVYAPSGAVVLRPGGPGRLVATSPYLRATWRINPLVDWQVSAVRAEPGDAMRAAGGRHALGYAETAITARF
jgi:hypothetical protein